jgi:flagellar protein FlaJ
MALISSFRSLPKLINKDLFKQNPYKEVTGSDLFYHLTYMSAIASSGIARNRIFQMATSLPMSPSAYFERIQLLVQKMGYDYTKACNSVGLAAKSEVMASLLLRMGNAFTAGQQERDFLAEEAGITGQIFEKEYERDIASLTKWTDAYAAITVSSTLIVIINMTSSMIQTMGDGLLIGLVITAAVTTAISGWVLSRAAPQEEIDLFTEEGPRAQRMALKLRYYSIAAAMIICPLLWLWGLEPGWVLMICAIILLPLGIFSILAGQEIDRKDREFGPFLRSLGAMAVSTGTTIGESSNRIDISSFPALEEDLTRLRRRLAASLDPELCWHKFAVETGSKLLGDTVKVFNDATKLGADPDVVALLAADYSSRTIMLRAKRKVTASTFTWLTIIMHGVVSGLMVLVFEIVKNFSLMLEAAVVGLDASTITPSGVSMPMFNTPNVELFRVTILAMIILFSVINAFSISATDGGHKTKISFYLSLMLILSGLCMLFLPSVVEGFLKLQ